MTDFREGVFLASPHPWAAPKRSILNMVKKIANFTGKLLQNCSRRMRIFQDTFETRKQSFVSAFSNCMAVPLIFVQRRKVLEVFLICMSLPQCIMIIVKSSFLIRENFQRETSLCHHVVPLNYQSTWNLIPVSRHPLTLQLASFSWIAQARSPALLPHFLVIVIKLV